MRSFTGTFESHDHEPGLFNFYDYWKMLRDWRAAIGNDKIMIGHGGGLLVASDFVEGFDACLTGEAQKELDPAIHAELLPLWQMWRAFPVEKARVYTYLTPNAVSVDNEEIAYSLWVTDDPYYLLIVSNTGGPFNDSRPAVGVEVSVGSTIMDGTQELKTWRFKGERYETFRIEEVVAVTNGKITVPGIMQNETIGFIMSPDEKPVTLEKLEEHLAGRSKTN